MGIGQICVENLGDAEAAAEGSNLGIWTPDAFTSKNHIQPNVNFYDHSESLGGACSWERGILKAKAQNLARCFTTMPANLLSSGSFIKNTQTILEKLPVDIQVHEKDWIVCQKMCALLAVTEGSYCPPKFLELSYTQGCKEDSPCIIVAPAITDDSCGIKLGKINKKHSNTEGAACAIATLAGIALLKVKINLTLLIPLCENMAPSSSTKAGDVLFTKNGKSINMCDAEAGIPIILAETLSYSATLKPQWLLDVSVLTQSMMRFLDGAATGVYTNSDRLYTLLNEAAANTGDRVWRFPIWKHYNKQLVQSALCNFTYSGKQASASQATAFLSEFVPECTDWLHFDIAGAYVQKGSVPYLNEGTSGRPTRTLIEFIEAVARVACT